MGHKILMLTVFLLSANSLRTGHDGVPVGVTRRHERFPENTPGIAAHLNALGSFQYIPLGDVVQSMICPAATGVEFCLPLQKIFYNPAICRGVYTSCPVLS